MRRATTKLISLTKISSSSNSISHNFTSQFSSSLTISNKSIQNSSPISYTHLKPCSNSKGLLYKPQNFSTHVENSPNLSSRQRKIKAKSQLEDDFEVAETVEEMLEAFKKMEASFDESDLGLACLKIGLKLEQEGEKPEKVLSYATRALNVFDSKDGSSDTLPVAMTLQLLGSTYINLSRFNDALGCLNRANKILNRLIESGSYDNREIMPILHAVQLELANVKTGMGRREESLEHLRKSLEIKEVLMGADSREFGKGNRDVAEAYVSILNFKEGLPYCLKALEIHLALLGENSVEVAHDRRLLGVIYTGLDQHKKALEQNTLAQKVLKSWGRGADLLRAEIDAANMNIALGRCDVAIESLKEAVQKTEKDSETRALIFITMGKALVHEEKFADAKRCFEVACGVLDKKERTKPAEVSEAYMEISMEYETMNEFETAISLLKRSLSLVRKLPQEQHSEGSVSSRIGWLLLLTGKVAQAIPYLEDAADTLKECFGPKHFAVGYIYNNLGAAYLELERPQSAAQVFAVAKDIMDVSLGPHHADSIEACQNLSKAYAAMGSYGMALEFQEKAVAAWEDHGRSAVDERREACRVLEELKSKIRDELLKEGPRKVQSLPQSNNARPSFELLQPDTSESNDARPSLEPLQPDTSQKSS